MYFWERGKSVRESDFWLNFRLFTGKNWLSQAFIPAYWALFSLIFEFLAHFFDFFLGLKTQFLRHSSEVLLGLRNGVSGTNLRFLSGRTIF